MFTSHLSLWSRERLIQAEALLGSEWIGSPDCNEPVILCGDFNAKPSSIVCKRIGCKLRDVQTSLQSHNPFDTWMGHYPFSRRIDHIFVSPGIKVMSISVPQTELEKVSSDHLPLVVELKINGTAKEAQSNLISHSEGKRS